MEEIIISVATHLLTAIISAFAGFKIAIKKASSKQVQKAGNNANQSQIAVTSNDN
jgi:hypothetical protein